jgi:hypothetical protein
MKENKLPLSEFANEEGFELNRYLTHLFEIVSTQIVELKNSNTILPPATDNLYKK